MPGGPPARPGNRAVQMRNSIAALDQHDVLGMIIAEHRHGPRPSFATGSNTSRQAR